MEQRYDAFLSYNSRDRVAVEPIARHLKDKAGLKLFFDEWEMIPGSAVQESLEKALAESACCVVFIGPSGLGPYQNEEVRISLEKSITEKDIRVIPVLLPGGKRETRESALPAFLRRLSWVEFPDDLMDVETLHRLECGIKNISPGPGENPVGSTPGVCPYRGLEVFREQDREFYFGRDTLVQRLMARLQGERFLALIGPSGSGKSSVLQAGLIPLLRPGSLVALLTPRERPLEELAFAIRRAAAPGVLPYSPAEILKQLRESGEGLHYLAREILQTLPGDRLIPVQRFVVIVDQLEELFTLTQTEEERREFIRLLLRAVEMEGGPVTVILSMRSDFIGKCAPYRDLNIYISEHLDQVEPMTPAELRTAIEYPAKSVGLEFDAGLVEIMLADVKGSNSELPLVEHALMELFHFQPRPGNRLTAQAYEAIGRVEGALVRRAEKLYTDMTPQQQVTLRKMFLLGLIHPGEGAPDTRRRALKEELLVIGGDAKEAEMLLNRLATARLLTLGRDEKSGYDTVEVAHEALIRKWERIAEWMAEGREIARQRGLLRQAAGEWEKNQKNPEYLFRGTRLAQMEEFVDKHHQDLGTLEKEFVVAGVAEREVQRRKKRRNIRVIIGSLIAVLLVVTYFAYWADRNEKNAIENEKKVLKQLAINYWDNAQRMREDNDQLKSLHLFCGALTIEKDKTFRNVLLTDMNGLWKTIPLLNIFPHEKEINGAIFNKDGTRILTWSGEYDSLNGTARLWDTTTGKPFGEIMKHRGYIHGAIFNKNETRILSWGRDGTARLWDAATGKPFGKVMKHEKGVKGAIFNHDCTRILTRSGEYFKEIGAACLWDAATGKPIGMVMKHDGVVNGAIFNHDETRILTWSDDNTARLWDATTCKPTDVVMKHDGGVNGAVFNKDETRILTWSNGNTAWLWNAASGTQIGAVMKHDGWVHGAIFNKDETNILTWCGDPNLKNGMARLWDATTGKAIGEIMKHENVVRGATFNQKENCILTRSDDGTARLWEVDTGAPIGDVMRHEDAVRGAVFNKDETLILTRSNDGTAKLWDAATGKPIDVVMKHNEAVLGAVFNKDETRILTWSKDGTARLWDATIDIHIGVVMKNNAAVHGAIFNKNETRILTWSGSYSDKNGTAQLWDAFTGKPIGPAMKHNASVDDAIFNKDETRILTWSSDGSGQLWDAATGKPIGEVMKHDGSIWGAIFNRKETYILTWSTDSTARLWDAATGKPSGEVMKHGDRVRGAIFNQDETRILTWSEDYTACLWDAATGKPIGEVMKHDGYVNGALFNRSETRILTWSGNFHSRNGTARLWDAATGKPIGAVMKHKDRVNGVIFNRNESRILTWSDDGTARLWEPATGKPIGEVMKHDDSIWGAIFNRKETYILTWSTDGTARLWDAATGKPIGEVMKHEYQVNGAILNGKETRILTWCGDYSLGNSTARLWDAATGRPIGVMMKHKNDVKRAIFNKDETLILTLSGDPRTKNGSAQLWDASTGKPIGEVMKHEDTLWRAIFNKDGTRILTWCDDKTARLWDIAIDPDFPMEFIKLQAMAITGTSYDVSTNTVNALSPEEWRKIKEKYMAIAAQHYKSCLYPEGNVFRRLFPDEARKVRSEGNSN